MAARGCVQDGERHAVVGDIEYCCHQDACIKSHSLTRFEIEVRPIGLLDSVQQPYEGITVIVVPGDVVASSEIQPSCLVEQAAEIRFYTIPCANECIAVLFTQIMEMVSVNTVYESLFEGILRELLFYRAQS